MSQLALKALSRNPFPELGVDSVLGWHKAVAELYLEFAQLSEEVAPLRLSSLIICGPFKSQCLESWPALFLALAISSLMRPLFGLRFVALDHGESRRVSMENGE